MELFAALARLSDHAALIFAGLALVGFGLAAVAVAESARKAPIGGPFPVSSPCGWARS